MLSLAKVTPSPPVITSQPQDLSVAYGENALFTVQDLEKFNPPIGDGFRPQSAEWVAGHSLPFVGTCGLMG
jgi:hypothetical protein